MGTLQWLLALHVTGAFLFLGGTVLAGVCSVLAARAGRPSEVAVFLGLVRVAVIAVVVGVALVLVFGLWLVHCLRLSYGSPWIVASIVLLVASSQAGRAGGKRESETRRLALGLAADRDELGPELRARLHDGVTIGLSWGAGLAGFAILALMIWKPGA